MAVIEVCTFTLVDSADVEAMLAADARMQTDFAYQQPGLARRTTARDDDGRWCVLCLWSTAEDAAAADAAAKTDEVAQQFWALVDRDSVSVQRFTLL